MSDFRRHPLFALAGFAAGVLYSWGTVAAMHLRDSQHSALSQHEPRTTEPSILTCALGIALWVYLLGVLEHRNQKAIVAMFSLFGAVFLVGLVRDLVTLIA
jgi:hypothetical protein